MVKNIVKGKYKKISYFLLVICLMCLFDSVSAFGKQYKIRDYDVKITVPSDYDVIIKNEDNTAVYKKLGVNEKSINNYMEPLNIYFLATTQDLKKIIALTRKQDEGTKKYYNMTDLDNDIIDALAEGFAQGVKAEDYGIERVNDITYVKLKYDIVTVQNEHLYYLKYKTIYNGYDYMVYTQKYSEITSDDEDELKKVISSFKIKNLNNSNASSISYAVPLLMILIFGTIICLWNVSKQKKNKNKDVKTKKLKS